MKYASFYSSFFSALCIFNKRRKPPAGRGLQGDLAVICCKDLSDLILGLPGSIQGSFQDRPWIIPGVSRGFLDEKTWCTGIVPGTPGSYQDLQAHQDRTWFTRITFFRSHS